ncbi:MAG: hypothetical protein U0869_11550 [Chloroflexota bacterium]
MPHPLLGLPPSDIHAGLPDAAARLRAQKVRLAQLSLEAALRIDPTFTTKYDETLLRRVLRDYDRHIEQLARALETGEERFVTQYAEQITPAYRRRGIRMNDAITIVNGMREAVQSALDADESKVAQEYIAAMIARLRRHARLPGDHKGNWLVRLIWKGAGLGDDTVV